MKLPKNTDAHTWRTCKGPGCTVELPPVEGRGRPRLYCSARCGKRYNEALCKRERAQLRPEAARAALYDDETPCPYVLCQCGRDYATLPL